MINLIIRENLCDTDFLAENVDGFDELAAAVSGFTPEYAAERADVPVQQIIDAARLFATHGTRGGMVNAGTGANMGRARQPARIPVPLPDHGVRTLGSARLTRSLRPNTLLPAYTAKAQPHAPYEGWGYGENFGCAVSLIPSPECPRRHWPRRSCSRVRARCKPLICVGGNPMAAWPDQRKTEQALENLELLVTLDTEMSGTSRMADYVIAPLMQMETPAMTAGSELIKYFTSGTGIPAPYAQYAPRLIDPPPGSDLTEEWQFFLGLAKRMNLELWFVNFFGSGGGRFMESATDRRRTQRRLRTHHRGTVRADVLDVAHSARRGAPPPARQHLRCRHRGRGT